MDDNSAYEHRFSEEPSANFQLNGVVDGDASSIQQSRRPRLSSLQIPARSMEIATSSPFARVMDVHSSANPSSNRAGLPPRPNSARFTAVSVRSLLPQKSFWMKDVTPDNERTVLIMSETPPSSGPAPQPSTLRSFSLNKMFFSPKLSKGGHSLPVTPMVEGHTSSAMDKPAESQNLSKRETKQFITRSFSVPADIKSRTLKRTASSSLIRVVPSTPKSDAVGRGSRENASTEESAEISSTNEDASEDIPEEDAVCRICMVELGEGGETLKMECSCKGELALSHQDCALKWFSIKGNKICDVCHQEVRNLPVTLLKITNPGIAIRRAPTGQQQREVPRYRQVQLILKDYYSLVDDVLGYDLAFQFKGDLWSKFWPDVPVLVMVSVLAYFCFLEQLLVSDMGPRALAVSLPFSSVLGLVSSLIASTMVIRNYIWAYACFQFASVILFAHIFYAMLNINAILSIVLSSFTGFGIAISTNALTVEYARWRIGRQTMPPNPSTNQWTREQQRFQNRLQEA
ncbi:hypothetical protein MLD38_026569 [Melastoma candidum]|uniref:Uncharacterized protein n=1 Tax=Melastoma candidum TaxID=119954 RepID=A0ACB9P0D0_9MYRT|nr:hypothetical protein MLD38_026569 [Melastoma candidum]